MSEDMTIDYYKLLSYIDAASNLAESLSGDIKGSKKGRISSETVVNLAKFYKAAYAVQGLLDSVELNKESIN